MAGPFRYFVQPKKNHKDSISHDKKTPVDLMCFTKKSVKLSKSDITNLNEKS